MTVWSAICPWCSALSAAGRGGRVPDPGGEEGGGAFDAKGEELLCAVAIRTTPIDDAFTVVFASAGRGIAWMAGTAFPPGHGRKRCFDHPCCTPTLTKFASPGRQRRPRAARRLAPPLVRGGRPDPRAGRRVPRRHDGSFPGRTARQRHLLLLYAPLPSMQAVRSALIERQVPRATSNTRSSGRTSGRPTWSDVPSSWWSSGSCRSSTSR
jgi:hypothetical protein